MAKGESMEGMWMLLCNLQLVSMMPLLALNFPPNIVLMFNFLSITNGEIEFMKEFVMNNIFV